MDSVLEKLIGQNSLVQLNKLHECLFQKNKLHECLMLLRQNGREIVEQVMFIELKCEIDFENKMRRNKEKVEGEDLIDELINTETEVKILNMREA